MLHSSFAAFAQRFALNEPNNLLKGQFIGIQLAVENDIRRQLVEFGHDMLHVGKRFAHAAEESLVRNADATGAVEFGLDKAGINRALAALVVIVGQHGKRDGCVDALAALLYRRSPLVFYRRSPLVF